jgi:hypothetical protein
MLHRGGAGKNDPLRAIGKFSRASFAASVAGVSVELFETMTNRSRA